MFENICQLVTTLSKLPTLEEPNIDEAIDIVQKIVEIALDLRKEHNALLQRTEQKLAEWLTARTVKVKDKKKTFTFVCFEKWVNDYDCIVEMLGSQYSQMVADELKREDAPKFDIKNAMNRVSSIFDDLWNNGEQSREILWEQVAQYVSLKHDQAVIVAYTKVLMHITSIEMPALSTITKNLADCIVACDKQIDWKKASEVLYEIISKQTDVINDVTINSLGEWIKDVKGTDAYVPACKVLKLIWNVDDVTANSIVSDLISNMGEIVKTYLPYIATNIEKLNDGNIATINSTLTQKITRDATLDEVYVSAFEILTKHAPNDVWSDKLESFTDALTTKLAQPNNTKVYVESIFPISVNVTSQCSNQAIFGNMLNQLFNTHRTTETLILLFSAMKSKWPEQNATIGQYNPTSIFNFGIAYIKDHPSASYQIISSMFDMYTRKIVQENLRPSFITTLCTVWKNSPIEAKDIVKFAEFLTSQQIAELARIDTDNTENINVLHDTWEHILSIHTDNIDEITTTIINFGELGKNDLMLSIWCDLLPDITSTFKNIATHYKDSDANLSRLWNQMQKRSDKVSVVHFIPLLCDLVMYDGFNNTNNTIENIDFISGLLKTTDNKLEMAKTLMATYTKIPSTTMKGKVCKVSNILGGDAAIQYIAEDQIDEDDLKILQNSFGNNKYLKKLQKNYESRTKQPS